MSQKKKRRRTGNGLSNDVSVQPGRSTGPDLGKPVASNGLEAETLDYNVTFTWRGTEFVIDLRAIEYGRGTYAMRVVANEDNLTVDRINAAIDVYEAAIGKDQLKKAYEIAPNLFDDEQTRSSFWNAFTEAMHGADAGESSAS